MSSISYLVNNVKRMATRMYARDARDFLRERHDKTNSRAQKRQLTEQPGQAVERPVAFRRVVPDQTFLDYGPLPGVDARQPVVGHIQGTKAV